MEEMREIVDIDAVDAAIKIGGVALFAVSLTIGAIVAAVRRTGSAPIIRAAVIAVLGPLLIGLWLLYSYMVRYDPETGYFGLDKIWVLALNAVIFIVIGAAYGHVAGRIWSGAASPKEAASAEDANESA